MFQIRMSLFHIMQIFKDKNACLKIRTSYFILCKYLKIKMHV